METKNLFPETIYTDQLKKYAEDFSAVYRSEKHKTKELKSANQQLVKFADDLIATFTELKDAHAQLKEAYIEAIHRLALAAEYKDQDTGDHIMRISRYSALMAEKLGLSKKQVSNIFYASPMHDVGKIGIPDNILMFPGKLSDEEFELMKAHTTIGGKILENSSSEILQQAHQIALYHHEKWNGRGYPEGLAGEQIPIAARIVGLVDVFDALTSERPYKDPYPVEVALKIIKKERGRQFDPAVTDVFVENIDDIVAIRDEVGTGEQLQPADFIISERDRLDGIFEIEA